MKINVLGAVAISCMMLAGCTGDGGTGGGEQEQAASTAQSSSAVQGHSPSNENELLIYTVWPQYYIKEDVWQQQVGQYLTKKFPGVVFKHIQWDNPGRQFKDLIAAGTIPDIIIDDSARNTYREIRRYGLEYDMSELVKKYNFDTGTLNPGMLQQSVTSSDGKLYSLPYSSAEWVLVYNKDIFDKFGVEYPKPGLTWDEAYELAKKLTRQDGEVTYKGFQVNPSHYMMWNQLSEPSLDPNEDKATLTSDNWTKITNNIRRFYEIPGNQLVKTNAFSRGSIAMAIDTIDTAAKWANENKNLNWDFSSVPVFPEAPGKKFQPQSTAMFITNQSKNKDLAFQVISYILSPEMQLHLSRQGVMTASTDAAVQQAFGQDLPEFRGKNTQSLYALESALPPTRKPGLTYIFTHNQIDYVWKPLIHAESKETVTALRMANELANKAIQNTKAAEAQGVYSEDQ
ncbi:glycerol-3-phosphate transporter periplasmic binding protein [Paenibacillus konkukensis]|uniref:Glycerol-3-phosphate transporter periplasmic binding protein n=2 Tax=Paenibacillus konkukensis TaxID=2020716 RepID=A0ABY4RS52_9BACL|nr:glycerol-3-phosphate transporter periplasmic binding protein [Paenibacillus konkukensis]